MPTPPPSAPPLSAVAARKAALALLAPPPREESTSEESSSSSEEEIALEDSSAEEDEDAAEEAALAKKKKPVRPKKKPKGAGRYFMAAAEEEERNGGRGSTSAAMEVDDDEDVLEVPNELEVVEEVQKTPGKAKMGRGKRQRQEKRCVHWGGGAAGIGADLPCAGRSSTRTVSRASPQCWRRMRTRSSGYEWRIASRKRASCCVCRPARFVPSPFAHSPTDVPFPQTLVIHGTYSLTPVFGSVSLLGSTLSGSPASSLALPPAPSTNHAIFAPSSHPLPIIEASQIPFGADVSSNLTLPDGRTIDLSRCSAAVLLSDRSSGVEGVETVLKSSGMGCGNGMWLAGESVYGSESSWGGAAWKLVSSGALKVRNHADAFRSFLDSGAHHFADFAAHARVVELDSCVFRPCSCKNCRRGGGS